MRGQLLVKGAQISVKLQGQKLRIFGQYVRDVRHLGDAGVRHLDDAPPPSKPLDSLAQKFVLSYDLENPKKCTSKGGNALFQSAVETDRSGV